ncbi:NADAR family protein [Arthrobacter koreensis]|uniref:NADAR family protein n=1 Tax=Arthrobacter koreensis TaxID=199136 RepID=UPI00380F61A3
MTAAALRPRIDTAALDAATAAVLIEKYGYTDEHLNTLKQLGSRTWVNARHEVETAAAVLAGSPPPVTAVTEFQGEHRFLSNFWPLDEDASVKDYTAEHWYQAEKTTVMAERDAIRACKTPGEAKELSQNITVREDWDNIKLNVMRKVLEQKFSLPWLRFQLLATGSAVLIEGNNWCDTFWGVCHCPRHGGEGMNWLGLLLMQKRNELGTTSL